MTEQALSEETDDLPVIPLAEVQADKPYPLAAIMAPVFDAKGRVSFALVMAGFHSAMTGAQTLAAGRRLRAACDRVGALLVLAADRRVDVPLERLP